MTYSENEVIAAIRKDDEKAFSQLVDFYSFRLCVYVNSLVRDMPAAEDIVQNVFIKVWERRKFLREDLNVKSLLYKYAYNEFVDYYRKRKSILKLEKHHIDLLYEVIEEEGNQPKKRIYKIIMEAIQELPPKCRQTILLSKQEGLSNIEISEYQKVSIRTVEKHLSNAYKLLRDRLSSNTELLLFLLFSKKGIKI